MLWKVKVPMTFTFEVSNGLYESKETRNTPLRENILREAGETMLQGFFRFFQLELKLPSIKIRAKVDSGINKRGVSSKEFRKHNSKKGKTLTVKCIEDLKDLNRTHSSRRAKMNKEGSIQEIIETDEN
jgi:hypothetical protein